MEPTTKAAKTGKADAAWIVRVPARPGSGSTKAAKTGKADAAQAKRKLPTPQEFYEHVTQDQEVRELLSRLAKK